MPSIKDFASAKGTKLKSESEQKWAIAPLRRGTDQRRRPGRGVDAVFTRHDRLGEEPTRQIETNEDRHRASSEQPQIETNGDANRVGATGSSSKDLCVRALPDAADRQIETNEDRRGASPERPQIETNGDRYNESSEQSQIETNGDANRVGATGSSSKNLRVRAFPDAADFQIGTNGDGRHASPEQSQIETNRDKLNPAEHPVKTNEDSHLDKVSQALGQEASKTASITSPLAAVAATRRHSARHSQIENAMYSLEASPTEVTIGAHSGGGAPEAAAAGVLNGDKSVVKWRQGGHKIETNGDGQKETGAENGDRGRRQIETADLEPEFESLESIQDGLDGAIFNGDKQRQMETNALSSSFVSISKDSCLHLKKELSPLEAVSKWRQETHVSNKPAPRLHLQIETDASRKSRQTDSFPTSSQLRIILCWLAHKQVETGLGHTRRIKRPEIASDLGIPLKSVAKQLSRLLDSGHLDRLDGRRGRGDSGSVFLVPNAPKVVAVLQDDLTKWRQTKAPNGDTKCRQGTISNDVVSSRSINNTTTTPAISDDEILRNLVDRFRLTADFSLTVNELRKAHRTNGLTLEAFVQSVEHLAFYLRSPLANGIRNARAWFLSMIAAGYYEEPIGFVSWEDEQLKKQLQAQEAKLHRTRELQRQVFDASYDTWFLEQSDEALGKLASAGGLGSDLKRSMLKRMLRATYAELCDQELPEEYRSVV